MRKKFDIENMSMLELESLREKLNRVKGVPMTYKQLSSKLGLDYCSGGQKNSQLKELGLICELSIEENPNRKIGTKFIVTEVFDSEILPFIHGNNKFQQPIEYIIGRVLEEADFQDIYYTNAQLLECLYLVNENYGILKNNRKRYQLEKLTGESYWELYKDASKAGEILMRWVNRALERMEKRGLIFYRKGFCLVKRVGEPGNEYLVTEPVPLASTTEKRILNCYNKAIESLGVEIKNQYIPPDWKKKFYDLFDQFVREEFGEGSGYIGAYKCNVITPSREANLRNMSNIVQTLNGEAKRKIQSTTQLDYMTGADRKRLIKEIISLPPSEDYKARLALS